MSTKRGQESDWIWICVATLWRRWFPEQPSFEELDDKMQAGYELLKSSGAVAACRIWLEAWNDVLHLLDKAGIDSIEEFDERFRGTQSLFNWIQDLEREKIPAHYTPAWSFRLPCSCSIRTRSSISSRARAYD